MQNSFYKVELSTGKTFNATNFGTLISRDFDAVSHVYAEVPIASTTYEKLKKLINGTITSVTVSTYKSTAPSEYNATPTLISTQEFKDFGDIPTIEATEEGTFKIKFFIITDASKLESQQAITLAEASAAVAGAYETLLL